MDRLTFDASSVHPPEPKPEGIKMTPFTGPDSVSLLRNQIALLGGCAWRQKIAGYPVVLHNLALAAHYVLHLIEVRMLSFVHTIERLYDFLDPHRDRRCTEPHDGTLLDCSAEVWMAVMVREISLRHLTCFFFLAVIENFRTMQT